MPDENIESLLETVADIAYIAGTKRYYGGDSREDIANFIKWAREFETHRVEGPDKDISYFGTEYMTAIDDFAERKINEQQTLSDPTA